MYESHNNQMWDVQEDGSVRKSKLVLESRKPPGALESIVSRAGTGTAVAAYAGTGTTLAWWWGSSGVFSFLGNAALWPVFLGVKALSLVFWPVLLAAAVAVPGWMWVKNKAKKAIL